MRIPWRLGELEFVSLGQTVGVTLLTAFTLDPTFYEEDFDTSLYILPA